jgi:hypothetical protein
MTGVLIFFEASIISLILNSSGRTKEVFTFHNQEKRLIKSVYLGTPCVMFIEATPAK